jgi:hypothetical protein
VEAAVSFTRRMRRGEPRTPRQARTTAATPQIVRDSWTTALILKLSAISACEGADSHTVSLRGQLRTPAACARALAVTTRRHPFHGADTTSARRAFAWVVNQQLTAGVAATVDAADVHTAAVRAATVLTLGVWP